MKDRRGSEEVTWNRGHFELSCLQTAGESPARNRARTVTSLPFNDLIDQTIMFIVED